MFSSSTVSTFNFLNLAWSIALMKWFGGLSIDISKYWRVPLKASHLDRVWYRAWDETSLGGICFGSYLLVSAGWQEFRPMVLPRGVSSVACLLPTTPSPWFPPNSVPMVLRPHGSPCVANNSVPVACPRGMQKPRISGVSRLSNLMRLYHEKLYQLK